MKKLNLFILTINLLVLSSCNNVVIDEDLLNFTNFINYYASFYQNSPSDSEYFNRTLTYENNNLIREINNSSSTRYSKNEVYSSNKTNTNEGDIEIERYVGMFDNVYYSFNYEIDYDSTSKKERMLISKKKITDNVKYSDQINQADALSSIKNNKYYSYLNSYKNFLDNNFILKSYTVKLDNNYIIDIEGAYENSPTLNNCYELKIKFILNHEKKILSIEDNNTIVYTEDNWDFTNHQKSGTNYSTSISSIYFNYNKLVEQEKPTIEEKLNQYLIKELVDPYVYDNEIHQKNIIIVGNRILFAVSNALVGKTNISDYRITKSSNLDIIDFDEQGYAYAKNEGTCDLYIGTSFNEETALIKNITIKKS